MKTITAPLAAVYALVCTLQTVRALPAAPAVPTILPVREVTVFKDGHAFVLHSGQASTDANGDVQLDRLPTPVLGTFWPYSADKNAVLRAFRKSKVLRFHSTLESLRSVLRAVLNDQKHVLLLQQ